MGKACHSSKHDDDFDMECPLGSCHNFDPKPYETRFTVLWTHFKQFDKFLSIYVEPPMGINCEYKLIVLETLICGARLTERCFVRQKFDRFQ